MELYITAFSMGLFGSLHCLGMCGGISVAFNNATAPEQLVRLSFIHQSFRIISYAILGAISALLGSLLIGVKIPILTILSGVFMLFFGLYLINISTPLLGLEKIGHRLWVKLAPVQKRFIPIKSAKQAMAVGLLWGLLPCGLVYSALALSISSAQPLEGAIVMLFFGLGTLPMMLSVGLSSQKLVAKIRQPWLRNIAAIVFIIWGAYFIYSALANKHAEHAPSQSQHEHHMHH